MVHGYWRSYNIHQGGSRDLKNSECLRPSISLRTMVSFIPHRRPHWISLIQIRILGKFIKKILIYSARGIITLRLTCFNYLKSSAWLAEWYNPWLWMSEYCALGREFKPHWGQNFFGLSTLSTLKNFQKKMKIKTGNTNINAFIC